PPISGAVNRTTARSRRTPCADAVAVKQSPAATASGRIKRRWGRECKRARENIIAADRDGVEAFRDQRKAVACSSTLSQRGSAAAKPDVEAHGVTGIYPIVAARRRSVERAATEQANVRGAAREIA